MCGGCFNKCCVDSASRWVWRTAGCVFIHANWVRTQVAHLARAHTHTHTCADAYTHLKTAFEMKPFPPPPAIYLTFQFQVLLLHPLEEDLLLDGCPPQLPQLIFAPANLLFWHVSPLWRVHALCKTHDTEANYNFMICARVLL